ncbi:MAG: tRNA (N6-isopentenyl adenosine(37)-C2)-methylthiotransferase MiaB [Nitrospirae bacterium]|nr:tRNA (N6-isopentenyl adenosine(37)-C2)-methylthiotransferase MiaB [Nitrospirota bacterium]
MKKYHIHTFGCQMNVHDSEKIAGTLSESGYGNTNSIEEADVIVLNTCSIREKAEHKFYSELGRLAMIKKNNPDLKIVVAGCIAQQEGRSLFKRFPYVDLVFGPDNIDNLQALIDGNTNGSALEHNPEYHFKNFPMKREGQVRAWVSIMYGCDNFCAYCVVPYTRGRERSRPAKDIYNEVLALSNDGFKEITLLGQNVNSYGKNLPEATDFADLLRSIHEIDGIQRIRFVTSHPRDLSEKLVETMSSLPKICNHLHLPVQSGSDKVLSQMNRGYTYEQYREKITMLRKGLNDIALTTDIIVGFPGEGEEDFRCTMNALKEIEFDGVFAFKYSKRPGTAAINLPAHIDEMKKSKRLSEVLDLQEAITFNINKRLEGQILEVLIEGSSETNNDKLTGRTSSNKIVNFQGDIQEIGKIVKIKILKAKQHSLYGEKSLH